MKIAVFGPERRVGMSAGDQIIDVNRACMKYLKERQNEPRAWALAVAIAPADLGPFVESGPKALEWAEKSVNYLLHEAGDHKGITGAQLIWKASEVKLHPPKPGLGTRVCCAGGNYAKHRAGAANNRGQSVTVEEMAQRIRDEGNWGFWKVNHEVMGPEDDIPYPSRTHLLDYEGEVAVIIGKRGQDLTETQAREAIWGVTLLNDWSIRDANNPPRAMSWNLNKNFNGSTSIGPCIVVGEIDPQNVPVKTMVNGQLRQDYSSQEMIFSFADAITHLSRDFTLIPGDIFSAGTGAGTAMDSSKLVDGKLPPDLFLKPG